ncbi:hypothetical protein Ga0074812_1751 [Parafrankia irregularis]|uniref:Uncharacterized protein n=1 Tax=Parafrankia irregularis TaxID=795642 RepID=A0A0S4R0L9_9ACTN|nr:MULTISPECIES: hypothetical protein [Parafrankia]MBE3206640.1 hypothetical protein [Parafrankia sp. CH37]CUU61283.1 hypothetical protein Ga0074812_1751 [Parafrankia irregularis]
MAMTEPLDRHGLMKLHEQANQTGSAYDRDTFAKAALALLPEILGQLDQALAEARAADGAAIGLAEDLDEVRAERDALAAYASQFRAENARLASGPHPAEISAALIDFGLTDATAGADEMRATLQKFLDRRQGIRRDSR